MQSDKEGFRIVSNIHSILFFSNGRFGNVWDPELYIDNRSDDGDLSVQLEL